MDKAPLTLELMPVDPAPAAKPATAPAEVPAAHATTEASLDAIEIVPIDAARPKSDPYAVQASLEYARGHIDGPLWDRALAQANGDTTAAAAIYVRARGTALRLFDRGRRADRAAALKAPVEDDNWKAPVEMSFWRKHRYAIAGGAAIVVVGIASALWLMAGRDDDNVVARVVTRPRAPAPVAPAPTVVAEAPKAEKPTTDFLKKVQDLRDAGNWNVLVLYAVEWTRKEPGSAAAWDHLRDGYQHLRQYEDARAAGAKAAQLAPDDARLWRKLADVNLDLDDPAGALAAFEQAVARNGQDVESFNQIALLEARLGRVAESKAAFERAAAASPGDTVTACLRAAVAQMPPGRDAYTVAQQIRGIDARCHGRTLVSSK